MLGLGLLLLMVVLGLLLCGLASARVRCVGGTGGGASSGVLIQRRNASVWLPARVRDELSAPMGPAYVERRWACVVWRQRGACAHVQ